MPSKGGRDRTAHNLTQAVPVVSGPPLVRSREEWAGVGFAEAELARPLHRGVDTERFQPAIGDVLQVFPHVGRGKTAYTKTQHVVRKRHFTFHRVS